MLGWTPEGEVRNWSGTNNGQQRKKLKNEKDQKKFTKKLKSSSILYNRLNFIKETLKNERHQKIQFKSERKKDK